MSIFASLFQNDAIKNMALGTLKKMMRENNLQSAIIKYDPLKDELDFDFVKDELTIIPRKDLATYQAGYMRLLQLGNTDNDKTKEDDDNNT